MEKVIETPLIKYIYNCINPKDETEFLFTSKFTDEQYDKVIQDAIIIANEINLSNDRKIEKVKIDNYYLIRKIIKNVAWYDEEKNTYSFDESKIPIYRRLLPPPIETVNHPFIISQIAQQIKKEQKECNYIEYGVCGGDSLIPISKYCDTVHGVDINNSINLPNNAVFYKMFTNQFSEKFLPQTKFNLAFIDADHASDSAFKDFENIYKYIDNGGYIFLHDTYPCIQILLEPRYCNDCFKTPLKIKEKYKDIELVTLPLNPGLTIVRKV